MQETPKHLHKGQLIIYGVGALLLGFLFIVASNWLVVSLMTDLSLAEFFEQSMKPEYISVMMICQACSLIGLFLLPSLIFSTLVEGGPFSIFELGKPHTPQQWLLLPMLFFSALSLIGLFVEINEHIRFPKFLSQLENWLIETHQQQKDLADKLIFTQSTKQMLLSLVCAALVPAFAEEFFFRGLLQRNLLRITGGSFHAVFFSALIFSIFHFQFFNLLPILFMGMVLGYLYYWSGSLWPAIIVHFSFNALNILFAYLKPDVTEEMANQPGSMLFWYIMAGISLVGLFYLYRHQKVKRFERGVDPNIHE